MPNFTIMICFIFRKHISLGSLFHPAMPLMLVLLSTTRYVTILSLTTAHPLPQQRLCPSVHRIVDLTEQIFCALPLAFSDVYSSVVADSKSLLATDRLRYVEDNNGFL